MPIYRIREYYSYYDEYKVDAENDIVAEELVHRFIAGHPVMGVEQVEEKASHNYHDTMILDENENLLV